MFCLLIALSMLCGCSDLTDTPLMAEETTTEELSKREHGYSYAEYCTAYPKFLDFVSNTTELYWIIDAVDEDSGQKIAAIHCENESEAYTLFQIGNDFWQYDYEEVYSVSNFVTITVESEIFYVFDMCRFFSTGGFYISDLLLISPNRENQIYSVTIEEFYDAVAKKIDIQYSKDRQELTVRDSKKTTILPLSKKTTETYETGFSLEKELKFVDLYVQMPEEEETEEKNYCWSYELKDGEFYIEIPISANYRVVDASQQYHYSEQYSWLGSVQTRINFNGTDVSLGDAVFTPA